MSTFLENFLWIFFVIFIYCGNVIVKTLRCNETHNEELFIGWTETLPQMWWICSVVCSRGRRLHPLIIMEESKRNSCKNLTSIKRFHSIYSSWTCFFPLSRFKCFCTFDPRRAVEISNSLGCNEISCQVSKVYLLILSFHSKEKSWWLQ